MKKQGKSPNVDSNKKFVIPDILRGAARNDTREVRSALQEDPFCINNVEKWTGLTALHIAASRGNLRMVEFLIIQPHINTKKLDALSRDPLDVAIVSGHPQIISLLFKKRAALSASSRSKSQLPSSTVVVFKPK